MKRAFAIVLAILLVLCLCACGGIPAPTTEPTTEATTEPIPDITVYAKIPEGWSDPACWSWQDGGSDAFESWPGEAMRSGNGWYSVEVPGWIDRVIINGNGGSIQTADLTVEAGRDVWVHVVNADYAFVHYEEPTEEKLEEELDQPALDYHQTFFRGGYQITGTKAVAFNQGTGRYCTDYVPEELLAENPEEAFYVVYIVNISQFKGYYFFPGETRSAIQPGVRIEIRELASDKVLKRSEDFMGGEPPETITWEQSGRGTEPDQDQICAWVETALAEVMQSTPAELPYIPLNEEALTEEEKAAAEAKALAERLYLSYETLVHWLVEYEGYTQEAAETAAANCGVDFKEMALLNAQEILFEKSDLYPSAQSRDGLIDWLVNIDQFTQEEAVYAADNCGADWSE